MKASSYGPFLICFTIVYASESFASSLLLVTLSPLPLDWLWNFLKKKLRTNMYQGLVCLSPTDPHMVSFLEVSHAKTDNSATQNCVWDNIIFHSSSETESRNMGFTVVCRHGTFHPQRGPALRTIYYQPQFNSWEWCGIPIPVHVKLICTHHHQRFIPSVVIYSYCSH
jgi:hypothetical protein